jgi:hypothetical protein
VAADKRVTRVVYGAFVALAAAFIVSSVWQIAAQLFGFGAASRPEAPRASAACATGLRELAAAVDRGSAAAQGAGSADEAEQRYKDAVAKTWSEKDQLLRPCQDDPAGPEAMAALARLDRAAEGAARRQAGELGPVRREVESFIR